MAPLKFRLVHTPRVSVIILAWKQVDLLLTCLRSLAETLTDDVPFEIIVVSNDAPQRILDALRRGVEGLRLFEAGVNLGFVGANNLGAKMARGEYLVLLNDDTVVAPGWLGWLVATADANPNAGAVGSLMLFPDGSIQEAGSIIWADGSTMPIGRGNPINSLEWQFVRKVDYVSACSLLVRRDAWNRVGGLDPGYYPVYYEDVDLCLSLRNLGYDVLFEPRSRVWHHESASANERFKRFLFERNQRRLSQKWAAELTYHEPAQPQSRAAISRAAWRAQGAPSKILAIDDRVPDPSLGAGFGRMFDAVLEIAACGHSVTVYPTLGVDQGLPDPLISAGIRVLDEDLDSHFSHLWNNYDVIIVSRPHNFPRVSAIIRSRQQAATLVYDCEALFWRRLSRAAALAASEPERTAFENAAKEMKALEERIVVEADCAVAVSHEEAELLRQVPGCCPVQPLLPAERSVAFGRKEFDERSGIGYVAGWTGGATSANADGLRWFVRDILPIVRKAVPWVRLNVTGASPPPDLLELGDPNLHFEGYVSDLVAFYSRHRVIIAPIRFGSGVKVKTVQALQHGVPVVSTRCGAEGIDMHGIDAIVIEDTPEVFADAVIRLLTDATQWRSRRCAIATLLERWRNASESSSWSDIIARALARRHSGSHPLLIRS